MRAFLILTLVLSLSSSTWAQVDIPQKIIYDQEVVDLVNKAKAQMKAENYEAANKTFRKALATRKILPTDLSYLFAETLYIIHQYQNSLNFVDKYIDLAGQGGNYYQKAVELKELLHTEFNKIKDCQFCNLSGYRYIECDNCHGVGQTSETCYNCKGSGATVCPKCMGEGVYITFNSFSGKQYHACDICEGKGYSTCHICEGDKILSGACSVCLGTKQKVSSILCDHIEDDHNDHK